MQARKRRHRTLIAYLEAERVSQKDFAHRVGVAPSYVSMITRGEREPALSMALRIAEIANIPIASLALHERSREAVAS